MTHDEFDNTGFTGNMFAIHDGEKKFVMSCNFPERLFGLLPEKPDSNFSDADMWQVDWVRCENVTEIIRPEILNFQNKESVN